MKQKWTLWLLAVFCCFQLPAQDFQQVVTVKGQVQFGDDGTPAVGIPVWITGTNDQAFRVETRTQEDGFYTVSFDWANDATNELDSVGFIVYTLDFCTGANQIQSIAFLPGDQSDFEVNFKICGGVNPPPTTVDCQAFFFADQLETDASLLVQFNDLSYSANPVLEWYWDFGDGQTADDPAPLHEYKEPGTYKVSLTIQSEDCKSEFSYMVFVSKENRCNCPDVYEPYCYTDLATGETLRFLNRCWAECAGYPADALTKCEDCVCPAIYDPVCIITDNGEQVRFDNLCQALCEGYELESIEKCDPVTPCRCPDIYDPVCVLLDNGAVRHFTNPCEAACLGYNNFIPCDSTYSFCQAAFFVEFPEPDQLVVLLNEISRTTSPVVKWHWDFGDDQTSEEPSPVHKYEREGNYKIVLTIGTEDGCQSRVAQEIRIGDPNNCVCPAIYDPVCVKLDDGFVITFPNACEANCAGFNENLFTECDTTNMCACPEIYEPVCVVLDNGDILTFENRCFAECEGYINIVPCNPGECVCTNVYDPVCVEKDGEVVQFGNKCLAMCEGFTEDQIFECDSTIICNCTREYNPVCVATPSGMVLTFSNPCLAECAGFPTEIQYPCDSTQHCYCPQYYDPVCVVLDDGTIKEFSNECFARCEGYGPDQYLDCNINCICTDEWDPVCVITAAGEIIQFGNPCEAECRGFTRDQFVDCQDQPCACPEYYDPVCVITRDSQFLTFPNKCFAACEGYYEDQFVPCDSTCVCPAVFAPVCVTLDDGTTIEFPNACEARCAGYGDDQIRNCDITCDCPDVYAPVCVRLPNGEIRSFPNECQARCAGYGSDHFVECSICDCSPEYDPVCVIGPDGEIKEFYNRCVAECRGYRDYFKCDEGGVTCYTHFEWTIIDTDTGWPTVQFNDKSFASNRDIIGRWWDFGDGTGSEEKDPVHRFPESGAYDITLTVETSNGCTSTTTQLIIVKVDDGTNGPRCQSMFYFNQINDRRSTFQFIDKSLGEVLGWNWSFGDGNYSREQNPIHTYENPGTYLVTLTVQTALCESKSRMLVVTDDNIWYDSTCTALFAPIVNQDDLSVFFLNLSSEDAVAYEWDFGDGNYSDEAVPSHRYETPGTYEIKLTILTAYDCRNSYRVTINFGANADAFIGAPEYLTTTNTSEEELSLTATRLYPNPAKESVFLEMENQSTGEGIVEIFNMSGQRVGIHELSVIPGKTVQQISTADLTAGMYLLRIQMGQQVQSLKLMVSK